MNSGKWLENLVQQIENKLLPEGFSVKSNQHRFNQDGIQIAEFDIEITGDVGSTLFKWLIECRDRKSQGPAPGEWIEQLVGRRDRFNFNKVTAVSTTGFSHGAIEYATTKGIELRTVNTLRSDEVLDWIKVSQVDIFLKYGEMTPLQKLAL